jgi:hypothetical protein
MFKKPYFKENEIIIKDKFMVILHAYKFSPGKYILTTFPDPKYRKKLFSCIKTMKTIHSGSLIFSKNMESKKMVINTVPKLRNMKIDTKLYFLK